jgi:hypothetical protein
MISQQTIDQVKECIVKEFDPIQIYIYGPLVISNLEESEGTLDILVVVEKEEDSRYKMLVRGHHVLGDLDVAKDISIYTKDEFERSSQSVTGTAYSVKRKGKLIYAKA